MRRCCVILFAWIFFAGIPALAGETGRKDTIIYLTKLQTSAGGFVPSQPVAGTGQPSLRASSSVVRTLRYLDGEVANKAACVKFVESCFDPESGGFRDTPGGKVDLFSTAIGVMAVVELKMPLDRYAAPTIRYLSDNAKGFEEIRIAAAALESLGKPSPRNEDWLKEIRKSQNSDGTFGEGAGQARATGGAVAAILRLGGTIADRDKVLDALKRGQRKSGGFGKADAGDASDLETSYRVMRAFMMLKSRPLDGSALQAFVGKCRNPDGGYGVVPGDLSSAAGTYYATSIRHWLK